MGNHRAGYVIMDESQIIRIDVPVKDAGEMVDHTEYYGRAAVYSMIPCTEEVTHEISAKYVNRLLRSGVTFKGAVKGYSATFEDDRDAERSRSEGPKQWPKRALRNALD